MGKLKIRNIASLLLTLLLSLTLCTPALAAGSTLSLSTADELKAFAANCSYDAYSKGLTVRLLNDIDLGGAELSVPIFLGTFDGQGHRITGVSLTGSASCCGFFSRITAGATVRDVTVEGKVTPSGTQSRVGGVVGENYGTVSACAFTGTVTGTDTVGLIAGYNGDGGVIADCAAVGVVHATTGAGGIVGQNYGAVRGCTNSAAINTEVRESEITTADLESTVYSLLKDEKTTETGANTDIGGIAGYSTGTIEGCTNKGSVGYPHVGYNVGGIVGRQDGLVSACINYGDVLGRKDVGGIVGQMIPDVTIQQGPDRVSQLRSSLGTLSDLTEQTSRDLSDTSDMVTTRIDRINDYANSAESTVKALVDDLNRDMTYDDLRAWMDKLGDSSDTIHGYLSGISNEITGLTGGLVNANKDVSADLRAVNAQFTSTMNLFLTLIDEATDTSGVVQDVSESTLYSARRGKAVDCVNRGSVDGDRSVGGIAGAMAIEYDYDREDDLLPSGSRTVKYTYLTRAILLDCHNYGTITAKKSCAGSVTGRMDLGTVSGCGGWGDVSIESGDYVGGVAGLSLTSVRRSYAKCTLSGGKYVGGIVGSGCNVTDCAAMPDITAATQYAGGVAGELTGTYSGNRFVSSRLAGVDRVSYAGKAEPVSYEQLLTLSGLPEDFRRLTLTFMADGKTVRRIAFTYGDSFDDSVFPEAPVKEGYYARWDRETLTDLRFDTVVTAVYSPYITTLSWGTAQDGRAALLVEGLFREGDRLGVSGASAPGEYAANAVASYAVTIPADGTTRHTVRYLLPDNAPRRLKVYTETGTGWQSVPAEASGSYLLFTMDSSGSFAVVKDTSVPLGVWIASGAAAGLALCAIPVTRRLRRRKASQKTSAQQHP